MMPRWAFGFWQCRERYSTPPESVDVLDEFPQRGIPVDVIVQDWQYWTPERVGLARLRPGALPRSRAMGRGPPRPARAPHDLGVAEVLSGHRQLQGARTRPAALYQPNLVEGTQDWLEARLHLLRRLQPDGAGALLVADPGRRCSRRASTPGGWTSASPSRRGAVPDARRAGRGLPDAHEPDRARHGRARAQRVPAGAQPGRVRRPARGGARPARRSS